MAHFVISYSLPLYNQGELLSGKLNNEILGYQNFKVSVKRNVPHAQIQAAIHVPVGYFIVDQPTVSPNPPKCGLYEVVTVSTNYSATAEGTGIERPSGTAGMT